MYLIVCWISPQQRNRFPNCFLRLKPEIHIKTLNTEPSLCKFRGLRYLQNKMWFRDRQVHFLTYEKVLTAPESSSEGVTGP